MPELLAYLKINGMGNMRNGRNGYENELNTDLGNIGNIYNTSSHNVALPNNVLTEVVSVAAPYTGRYFIFVQTAINGNSNGIRLVEIYGSDDVSYGQNVVSATSISGGVNYIQVNSIGTINITAGTKIIVRITQNSGITLMAVHTYLAPVYISRI